jgi:hypothetical protein
VPDQPEPGDRYWQLLDPIWDKVSFYDRPEPFLRDFAELPTAVGHLFAAHWCQSEVCNGGFHQFFTNSTGVLAPEALAGFKAIGATEWASLLEEAMRFFGAPYPREREVREERLSKVPGKEREQWDPFFALDDRFYEWKHAEDGRWERAADAFARANS